MYSPICNPGHDYGTDFYDFAIWEWNLYTNSCFGSWARQLSQAFDRQTVLAAPAPPTQHLSSSAVIWSKLHQILMFQTTGIVQTTVTLSYELSHIHPANQTCCPYWNRKGLQPWLTESMVGKEITAVLLRDLSKPPRMCYIGLQHFKFQLKTNFSAFLHHIANFCVIPAILLSCGMIYSKLFMGLK